MIQNAFNTKRLCVISGEIKTETTLRPSARELHLSATNPSDRKAVILRDAPNQIHVPTQAENDESRRKAGRRIGV